MAPSQLGQSSIVPSSTLARSFKAIAMGQGSFVPAQLGNTESCANAPAYYNDTQERRCNGA